MYTFTLADICQAKTISVEIKDDSGNVEGVVYLKEPSAVEGAKLQESITKDTPWHELVMNILALTLSDESGNQLVTTPADRKKLESMPPRMLVALRDPCLEMLSMSWSTKDTDKQEITGGGENIDTTLVNLDDQIAKTYDPAIEDRSAVVAVAVPIEGNENLHLDQDPGVDSSSSAVDPVNPFVGPVEVPSSHG
jgi:hypothetical protein